MVRPQTSAITFPEVTVMTTRPLHLGSRLLRVGLGLALAAFLGCSKEQPMQQESSHGDHTKTGPGKKTPDKHGGHDGGQSESMLMVSTEPAAIKPGEPVKLNLTIHDATGAM